MKKPQPTISPQYNPKKTEDKIYRLWEGSGFFNPDNLPKPTNAKLQTKNPKLQVPNYTIVVPPPNVTGSLHLGHALNATIQDILVRKSRMEGYRTLWLPGTDHAGIATQNVVEKELKKEGKTRHDLGREKLVERIWEWKEKYGNIIFGQFKKIGSSMDWSRIRFTMDESYQKAVEEAFLRYYEKGWIYRAERVINWCPRCQTSLADLELEHKEVETTLYYIRYPVFEKSQTTNHKSQINSNFQDPSFKFITVATTRPETMLGDAAVAVNPKDKRFAEFIGKSAILPIQNREIPIVADDAVEMEFGTGAVKVTPSHDLLDAEIAERHNLSRHTVINQFGKMTADAGAICEGLKTSECREKIVTELKKRGFLEKEESYQHNVSICYRCATVIEPIPSMQWFLKMKDLAHAAMGEIISDRVKFHPERWKKVCLDRLYRERDWTLSRQVWWGHRIPVWYCVGCGEVRIKPKIKGNWFFVRHGETDWNVARRIQGQSDAAPALNEQGRKQARNAALRLKPHTIDMVISSNLPRAKETAEIIAEEIGIKATFDNAFQERRYGILEGMTREEMAEKGLEEIRSRLNDPEFVPPDGESLLEVEERIYQALNRHKNHHVYKNVVIVSHGAALKSMLSKLKAVSPRGIEDKVMHNAEILHFSITDDCKKCGSDFVEQDPDVLDTWFSSSLWPFATLEWPTACKETRNKKQETRKVCVPAGDTDLDKFYPTQVLSTARDIIHLWVARMVFSGMFFMGKAPFSDVIIHATILTKEGKRMSKSLGTGVDPMLLIEKYGADALRFGLIWQAMGGQDIHWSEEHVIAGKKFANKVWNAARFVMTNLPPSSDKRQTTNYKRQLPTPKTPEDKEVLEKFEKTKKTVSCGIEGYDFGHALHECYEFFWRDFCDIYLEISKKQLAKNALRENTEHILAFLLSGSLKLLHPFMPFLTEEIWLHLPTKNKRMLMIEEWPTA